MHICDLLLSADAYLYYQIGSITSLSDCRFLFLKNKLCKLLSANQIILPLSRTLLLFFFRWIAPYPSWLSVCHSGIVVDCQGFFQRVPVSGTQTQNLNLESSLETQCWKKKNGCLETSLSCLCLQLQERNEIWSFLSLIAISATPIVCH